MLILTIVSLPKRLPSSVADTVLVAKEAVLGAVEAADQIGTDAGSSVRKALLASASLPKDIVESALGKN